MPTPQKEVAVSEISETLKNARAVIFTDYRGLTVAQQADLRKRLRDTDASFAVVKNTLFQRAANEAEAVTDDPRLNEVLNGPTAVAFAMSDAVASAKAIVDYIADNRNTPLSIKGGLLSGQFFTTDQVNALSKVPPRPVLIAQFVGALNSPITSFVGTLGAIVSDFVFTLQAVADKRQSEPAA